MGYLIRVYPDNGEGQAGGWASFELPDSLEPVADVAALNAAALTAFRQAEQIGIHGERAKLKADPPSVTR